jgi:hypothetical protein
MAGNPGLMHGNSSWPEGQKMSPLRDALSVCTPVMGGFSMTESDGSGTAGKVVAITGAGRGIGAAAARLLAARGAQVVLGSRGERELTSTAGAIAASGGQVAYRCIDVTRPEDLRALVDLPGQRPPRRAGEHRRAGHQRPAGVRAVFAPVAWTGCGCYFRAPRSSRQVCSQRRQASAQTRQCSWCRACRSHSSPQLWQMATQASSSGLATLG